MLLVEKFLLHWPLFEVVRSRRRVKGLAKGGTVVWREAQEEK